ncbi:hypothetical protein [Mesobacillus thioparans]|uniref:hypothetical protein n=1 Tax=Mesobacillus thioparans TaxID=370439 RepID=UPI0039F11C99
MKPIEEFHKEGDDYPFLSGEDYKKEFPLSLPYVYEFSGEDVEFLGFLDGFMEYGDVVEHYIYEEGKWGRALSSNHPEEARTRHNVHILNFCGRETRKSRCCSWFIARFLFL